MHPRRTFRVGVAYRAPYFGAGDRLEQLHITQPTVPLRNCRCCEETRWCLLARTGLSREAFLEETSLLRDVLSNPRRRRSSLPLVCSPPSIPPTRRVLILPAAGSNPLMRVARRLDRISLHRGLFCPVSLTVHVFNYGSHSVRPLDGKKTVIIITKLGLVYFYESYRPVCINLV